MFQIVLFEPEIPPNTGNIIRLAANTGCQLHLIKPLGFELDDKKLRRAGLDYKEYAEMRIWDNWQHFCIDYGSHRIFALTTKGSQNFTRVKFEKEDVFVFGPETRGLPNEILDKLSANCRLRIPMKAHSRSLNLSNSAAIVVYEAMRQTGFQFCE